MNTYQMVNSVGQTVNYTEPELKRIIDNGVTNAEHVVRLNETCNNIKYKVRDFFSEAEWEDGNTTFSRDEVNELLLRIGLDKLRVEYRATVTITATVTSYEAEDEDEAREYIENGIDLGIDNGDIRIESVEVEDIEVEEGY